jgi:hypothetical protein
LHECPGNPAWFESENAVAGIDCVLYLKWRQHDPAIRRREGAQPAEGDDSLPVGTHQARIWPPAPFCYEQRAAVISSGFGTPLRGVRSDVVAAITLCDTARAFGGGTA